MHSQFSHSMFVCVCIVFARLFFYFGGRFGDCKVCMFVYYLLVIVFNANARIKKSIQPKSKNETHTHTWAKQEALHNFQCVIAYWVFLWISVFLSVCMCFLVCLFVCLLQVRASQFIIWTRALFAVSNHTDLPNVTEYVMHIRIVHQYSVR